MTREQWMHDFSRRASDQFAEVGAPIPANIRFGLGFTSKGARSKRIGECWSTSSSRDGVFEIFISPVLEGEMLAATLTHEIIHAAVGLDAKHGPRFARVAKALGLGGKMTATVPTDKWREWAQPILASIGDCPHAPMSVGAGSNGPKQTTRMIKLVCDSCGWHCRTARSNIYDGMICTTGCGGALVPA